jgi:4,5-DOPA dioxygenase extradiol
VNQSTKNKMPVLFIGHGSPMNMVLDNSFTRSLIELGKTLPKPKAILVISAHWLTQGTFVAGTAKPATIYDFYGFPPELYKVKYNCPGSPEYAQLTRDLLAKKKDVACDKSRGLDHASYSILKYMFPDADIPVFNMSLDYTFNSWIEKCVQTHYDLGLQLRQLRQEGVLIIGSGNMVHNLDQIDFEIEARPFSWAVDIDKLFKQELEKNNHKFFIDFPESDTSGVQAAPTLDHYLPMIYILALQEKNEQLQFTYEGIQNGSISMRGFRIG